MTDVKMTDQFARHEHAGHEKSTYQRWRQGVKLQENKHSV